MGTGKLEIPDLPSSQRSQHYPTFARVSSAQAICLLAGPKRVKQMLIFLKRLIHFSVKVT